MDDVDVRTLDANLPYLQSNLTVKHIVGYLQAANLFSQHELDDITGQKDNNSQVRELIRVLKQAGDRAFDSFLRVLDLEDVRKDFVAKKLREERDKQRQIPQEWPVVQRQNSQQAGLDDALKVVQKLAGLAQNAESRYEKLESRYEKLEHKHEDLMTQMENYYRRVEKDKGSFERQLETKKEEIRKLREALSGLQKAKGKANKDLQGKVKALQDNLQKAEEDKEQMAKEIRRGKEMEDKVEDMRRQVQELTLKDKTAEDRFRMLAAEFEKAKKERDQALGTQGLLSGLAGLNREETMYKRGITPRD